MDDLRLQAVAARVVAWHNRHPLARRIGVQQVRSVGYVALSVGDGAEADAAAAGPAGAPVAASATVATAAGLSITEHTLSGASAAPDEADFEAAFAALAEHHAEDAAAAAPTAAAPDAGTAADTALPASADPVPAMAQTDIDADAFEIELDLPADDAATAAEPLAEPTVDTAAGPTGQPTADPAADFAADPAADPADTSPPDQPAAIGMDPATSALEARDGDVATLLAPAQPAAPAATPPLHIPTLRDRVLVRAQQPGVQGGLLTAHEGYRPTLHPHAQMPAWAQPAAEHGEGDRFMAPLSPRDVARWVARHGRAWLQAPVDGPVRRVSTAAVAGGPAAGTTYVMTAAIAGGGLTSRVLVGAGSPGAVLGARLWSLPRVAAAAALGAALLASVAVLATGWLRSAEPHAAPAAAVEGAAAAAAASAAAFASTASAASAAAAGAAASAPVGAPASAAEPAAPEPGASAAHGAVPAAETVLSAHEPQGAADRGSAPSAAAPVRDAAAHAPDAAAHTAPPARAELAVSSVRPVPAYAQKGAVGLPARGLGLSEADKAAAREAVAAARAGRPPAPRDAGSAGPAAGSAAPADPNPGSAAAPPVSAAAPTAPTPAAAVPAGPTFAISTRALRTRAEAEQLQVAITALLRAPGAASRRVELLPEGDDWRVVAWPFIGQAEADRVRALLAGRGMKVEVVRF